MEHEMHDKILKQVITILGETKVKKLTRIKTDADIVGAIKEKLTRRIDKAKKENEKIKDYQDKLRTDFEFHNGKERRLGAELNKRRETVDAVKEECQKMVDYAQGLPRCNKEFHKSNADNIKLMAKLNLVEAKIKYKEAQIKKRKEIEFKIKNAKPPLSETSTTKLDLTLKAETSSSNQIYNIRNELIKKLQAGPSSNKSPEIRPKQPLLKKNPRFEDLENRKVTSSGGFPKKLDSKTTVTSKLFDAFSENNNKPREPAKKKRNDYEVREDKSSSFKMEPRFNFDLPSTSSNKSPEIRLKQLLLKKNPRFEDLENRKVTSSGGFPKKLDSKTTVTSKLFDAFSENNNKPREPAKKKRNDYEVREDKNSSFKMEPRFNFDLPSTSSNKSPEISLKQLLLKMNPRFEDLENRKVTSSGGFPKKLDSKTTVTSKLFDAFSENNNKPREPAKKKRNDSEVREVKNSSFKMEPRFNFDLPSTSSNKSPEIRPKQPLLKKNPRLEDLENEKVTSSGGFPKKLDSKTTVTSKLFDAFSENNNKPREPAKKKRNDFEVREDKSSSFRMEPRFNFDLPSTSSNKSPEIRPKQPLLKKNPGLEDLENEKVTSSGRFPEKFDSKTTVTSKLFDAFLENNNEPQAPAKKKRNDFEVREDKSSSFKMEPRFNFDLPSTSSNKSPEIRPKQPLLRKNPGLEDLENKKVTGSGRFPKKPDSKIETLASKRFGALSENNNESQAPAKKKKSDFEVREDKNSSFKMEPGFNFEVIH